MAAQLVLVNEERAETGEINEMRTGPTKMYFRRNGMDLKALCIVSSSRFPISYLKNTRTRTILGVGSDSKIKGSKEEEYVS